MHSALDTDREELARRRRLAQARHERERDRKAVLDELIEADQRAGQLRAWMATAVTSEPKPELARMIEWAQQQLATLENIVDADRVSEVLRNKNLFPEIDDLADPLGEPPAARPWGR